MIKTVLVCLVISLFAKQQSDKGILVFKTEVHDFGKIPHGQPVTFIFSFTNKGKRPVIIFDVKPVCGCTIAEFTKVPINPNSNGLVKVTFNAASVQEFNKAIAVNTNSSSPTKYLTIKGEVY